MYTYLLFLLIEVVNDDSNEEIEREEGTEDNEEDKVEIHSNVDLPDGLVSNLKLYLLCEKLIWHWH